MSARVTVARGPARGDWLAQARRWRDGDGAHIDVRGLAPPGPLVAIMQLIAAVGNAATVIVHHDRDPLMLYPELAEVGWTAGRIDAPPGEVRLQLERTP